MTLPQKQKRSFRNHFSCIKSVKQGNCCKDFGFHFARAEMVGSSVRFVEVPCLACCSPALRDVGPRTRFISFENRTGPLSFGVDLV